MTSSTFTRMGLALIMCVALSRAHDREDFRSFVNVVRDFNADTTGLIDATDSIQAAINTLHYTGGGVVYFPPGKYRIDGTLYAHFEKDSYSSVTRNISFEGPSHLTSVHTYENCAQLIKNGTGDILRINLNPDNDSVVYYIGVSICGLAFSSNDTIYGGDGCTAIKGYNANRSKITYCNFENLETGINLTAYSDGLELRGLHFYKVKNKSINLDGADFSIISQVDISCDGIVSNYGISLNHCRNATIDNVIVNGTYDSSAICVGHSSEINLTSLHFEGDYNRVIEMVYSHNITIEGGYVQDIFKKLFSLSHSFNCNLNNFTIAKEVNNNPNQNFYDIWASGDVNTPVYGIKYDNIICINDGQGFGYDNYEIHRDIKTYSNTDFAISTSNKSSMVLAISFAEGSQTIDLKQVLMNNSTAKVYVYNYYPPTSSFPNVAPGYYEMTVIKEYCYPNTLSFRAIENMCSNGNSAICDIAGHKPTLNSNGTLTINNTNSYEGTSLFRVSVETLNN